MNLKDEQELINLKALIDEREEELFNKFKSNLKYINLYNQRERTSQYKEIITHG